MAEMDANVLEIAKTDGDHINLDKENLPQQINTNKIVELGRGISCPRTPLQSMNQERDGVIRPIYSPITPVSGAKSQTPRARQKLAASCDRRKTVCGFQLKPSPLNVMNTLLYNKAKELIEQGLQEERSRRRQLETLVAEKDEEILHLKAEVSLLDGRPTAAASTLLNASMLHDDKSVMTCKLSGVDYSKRTKDELVTELETCEMHNRSLRSELTSADQKCRGFQLELIRMKAARDEDKADAKNALEQMKVEYEHRISELLACQSQLTQDVSEREKAITSCRSEREKEVTLLNKSLTKLHEDLSLVHEQKKRETELCNEYRCQRQKDLERLQELETKLDEFAQIRPNITRAKLAQANIANVIRKAHQKLLEKNQAMAKEREDFLKQKVEWLKWKNEKEQSLEAMQEDCSRIEEVNRMDLTEQLASAESRVDGLLKQIICLEESLGNEKRITYDLTEKLNLSEMQTTNLNDQMAAEVERHELEVTNLQRTLDMREHEIDELTKECGNYKRLVTHMKAQTTKQQSINSKVVDLETQIELLAKDNRTVCEEMIELRKRSTELQQLTADHQELIDKTRSLEKYLLEKDDQIQCKERELSNAVIAVELLFKKASSFFDRLSLQWKAWNKPPQGVKSAEAGTPYRCRSQARTPVTSVRRRSRKSFCGPSFVCQILSACKQYPITPDAEPRANNQVPVAGVYESAMEERSLVDRAVIGHDNAKDAVQETELETPQLVRTSSHDSNSSDGAEVVSLHSSSSSYGERFTFFLDEIVTIFTKMESLLHGEVVVSFSHLRNLVNSLESRLSQQQHVHTKLMKEAQVVVRQAVAEASEEKRKAQIEIQRSAVLEDEVKEKTEQVNQLTALLQNKKEKLIQLADQSTEIQKLTTQLTSAQKKCGLKDEEILVLRSSLDERWQCIEANAGDKMTFVKKMEKEVISLKIQKQKLMQENADDKRKWEELRFRLEENHRVDTRNLRKAEEAIGQLDEKIERIRIALQPHLSILKTDKKLHQILCEIRALDF